MTEPLGYEYVDLHDLLQLHEEMITSIGGSRGIRDLGAISSALAQPRMTFGGKDFHPTVAEKAAALGFSLIQNHPFVDGNKRVGHAAVELFLTINGYNWIGDVDEHERIILAVASGTMPREEFTEWVRARTQPQEGSKE